MKKQHYRMVWLSFEQATQLFKDLANDPKILNLRLKKVALGDGLADYNVEYDVYE